jgi:transposase
MGEISMIGLDLAKSVFQVHAIDTQERVVVRRSLKRREVVKFFTKLEPCLVGMEACATAHYWARELSRLGHQVKLIPPSYVKPYVKRGKNDAADAAAICEALGRPSMSFVAIKSKEQQSVLALHRGARSHDRSAHAMDQSAAWPYGRVRAGGRQGADRHHLADAEGS